MFSGRFIDIPWYTISTEHLLARVGVRGVAVVSSLAGYAAINFPYQNVSLFFSIVNYHDLAEIECRLLNVLTQLADKKAQYKEYTLRQLNQPARDETTSTAHVSTAHVSNAPYSTSRRNSAAPIEAHSPTQATVSPSQHYFSSQSPRMSLYSPPRLPSGQSQPSTVAADVYTTGAWYGGWAMPSVHDSNELSLGGGGMSRRIPSHDRQSSESPGSRGGELQHLYRAGISFLGRRRDGFPGRVAQFFTPVVGEDPPPVIAAEPLRSSSFVGNFGPGLPGALLHPTDRPQNLFTPKIVQQQQIHSQNFQHASLGGSALSARVLGHKRLPTSAATRVL